MGKPLITPIGTDPRQTSNKTTPFGQFEIDHYKSFGIKVNNFIKIGALRLANAFKYIKANGIKLDKSIYDVCLIGEGVSGGNFRNDRLLIFEYF